MAAYVPSVWINNSPPALSAANLNKLTDELESQAAAKGISHSLPTWADGVAPALTDAAPLNEMERVVAALSAAFGLAYTRTTWQTGWTPARSAGRFNNLEQQVAACSVAVVPASSVRNGMGYLRYGNGELPVSHVADYDSVVTSWAGAPAVGASALVRQGLVYMSMPSCRVAAGGYHFGVSAEQARANNWVLLDSGGNEIFNAGYLTNVAGDFGLPAYQAAWCSNVLALINGWGIDGMFIDDVVWHFVSYASATPAKYPTQATWFAAVQSFCQAVYAYFHARSKFVAYNASAWYSGANDDYGNNDYAMWQALMPYGDAFNSETWVTHPNWGGGIKPSPIWDSMLRLPRLTDQSGKAFFCLNGSASASVNDWQICSMLLETSNGSGMWGPGEDTSNYDLNLVWHAFYDRLLTLGEPTGAKFQAGSEWRRQFSGGLVWVNPTNGTSGIV